MIKNLLYAYMKFHEPNKLCIHVKKKKLQLPVWYFWIFSQIMNAARLQFKTLHPFQNAVELPQVISIAFFH